MLARSFFRLNSKLLSIPIRTLKSVSVKPPTYKRPIYVPTVYQKRKICDEVLKQINKDIDIKTQNYKSIPKQLIELNESRNQLHDDYKNNKITLKWYNNELRIIENKIDNFQNYFDNIKTELKFLNTKRAGLLGSC
ncbi:MAG: hypothetical protein Edafosvirus3_63 [Edafosvirus sp.]|uniref:Uncharacterized protein n=1 Tax=Edafosvirus sp. TaxID=2487765 RepID=A0A3G4ZSX2_9VIRU|nr:MAG: hypothetical protein Edafosvirus3_63 [Edafosvirus sp.]